jgi:hypothetical protein
LLLVDVDDLAALAVPLELLLAFSTITFSPLG